MLLRREFLIAAGAFAASGNILFAKSANAAPEVPELLDHILLGCSNLDDGIAFVEKNSGVRAAFGGVHPGRGTRNALLSFGGRKYLEIIAPDPAQPPPKVYPQLLTMKEPRILTWAAHLDDLASLAAQLQKQKIGFEPVTPGSRRRPDGAMLHWSTLNLHDTRNGLFPFFIQWGAGSPHPSLDAPSGCSLLHFLAESPHPDALSAQFQALGLNVKVVQGDRERLIATLSGSHGDWTVSS